MERRVKLYRFLENEYNRRSTYNDLRKIVIDSYGD